jgi:hypothetical protein
MEWHRLRDATKAFIHAFGLLLETCIGYALRILNAKLNAWRCKVVCTLSSVPTLRSCAARCKRARLQELQNAPLGSLGHVLRSEGSSERTLLLSATHFLSIVLGELSLWGRAYALPNTYKPRGALRRAVFWQRKGTLASGY